MNPNELIEISDPRGQEYGYYISKLITDPENPDMGKIKVVKFCRDSKLEFFMTFEDEKMFKAWASNIGGSLIFHPISGK
jgi:hypothetical protein